MMGAQKPALGGARDVGFHRRGGAQRTGDATESEGVGEGGYLAVSVGPADKHVPATVDAPPPKLFGALSKNEPSEKKNKVIFIFKETKKRT